LAPIYCALTARAEAPACPALAPLYAFGKPLSLRASGPNRKLSILAIGSSSTAGAAATSPDRAYPAQLSAELRGRFHLEVEVRNAGVGGEDAEQTLVRLDRILGAQAPDLVIWQVGTNDALMGVDETRFRAEVDAGIATAKNHGVPMILMDPQLTRGRERDAGFARYAAIVKDEGARWRTPMVSRFEMMRALAVADPEAWTSMLSGDGIHMNDFGYACLAQSLAEPIAEAASAAGRAGL
jgi:lysophospholipase L1-like esterase